MRKQRIFPLGMVFSIILAQTFRNIIEVAFEVPDPSISSSVYSYPGRSLELIESTEILSNAHGYHRSALLLPVPQYMTALNHSVDSTASKRKANEERIIRIEAKHDKTEAEDRANIGRLLSCTDIAGLEIVRLLGQGAQKSIFEVKLPSGERAVAKRCHSYHCYEAKLIQQEFALLHGLHQQYGNEGALRAFGDCYVPFENNKLQKHEIETRIQNSTMDFSVGYTSVIEFAKPLVPSSNVSLQNQRCMKDFFTLQDIEDLTNIASRYANYSDSPILLTELNTRYLKKNSIKGRLNDNRWPQQYVTRTSGGGSSGRGVGTIHHADLDNAFLCKRHYKRKFCTVERVLRVNCQLISDLTNTPSLDCSFPTHSNTSSSIIVPSDTPFASGGAPGHAQRINTTYAIEECVAKERRRNNDRK